MVKLESYAVFEGGGIKGIAFAGALEAAERAGINFVGYAGASAGALVGFLACLGYSGSQIYNAIKHMDFSEFTHGDIQESTLHIKRVLYDIRK
ncbi:TPA: patatin-like phospholipase family protein, partial [Escherichia coli]|nr:patatin-like phospholipase family protein [Escherichia coli]